MALLAWLPGAAEVLAARPARATPSGSRLDLPPGARLAVVAPHPDDETLAAGGLVQQVLGADGHACVIFMTNGDGFSLAARRAFDKVRLQASDFRRLGQARQEEAVRALAHLGLGPEDALFLGFPDRGLSALWGDAWARPYRSPATQVDAVPYAGAWQPGSVYTGREVARQLDAALGRCRPDVVVAPSPDDFHPDHRATGLFTRQVLRAARDRGDDWALRATYLEYVIHREQWHRPRHGAAAGPAPAREGAGDGGSWVHVTLSPAQVRAKRLAIAAYRTQTAVMARFLYAFAGRTESFREAPSPAVPAPPGALAALDGR